MPIQQISPHFAIVKELPGKKDDFGTAERSGHWKWFIPQLPSSAQQPFSGLWMWLQSTLPDMQKCETWSYLPHRAFLESHLESHRFHCGLTLQESKRWPRANEIGGVEKLRSRSFRWGTSDSQTRFCPGVLGLPEDTWELVQWHFSWIIALNCVPFLGVSILDLRRFHDFRLAPQKVIVWLQLHCWILLIIRWFWRGWKVMSRQVAHSTTVVAPWNLSEKGLQRISSSHYTRQSMVLQPKEMEVWKHSVA